MREGWFDIPGEQRGRRKLEEQMRGLRPALDAARGKTVLDLGCAEGLIALEFAKAGALKVDAVDNNPEFIDAASTRLLGNPVISVAQADLTAGLPETLSRQYDIVLALAIVHKLSNPALALRRFADAAAGRLVIRLPLGSTGVFYRKGDSTMRCDTHKVMAGSGFKLEQQLAGPRREWVQHWVRA